MNLNYLWRMSQVIVKESLYTQSVVLTYAFFSLIFISLLSFAFRKREFLLWLIKEMAYNKNA